MHFAEELTGKYRNYRPAIAAISMSDVSHMACVGNDYGYDFVFSRYLEAIGREGDVLLGISTSGNSKNVLNAMEVARKKGIKIIGLTGKDGEKWPAIVMSKLEHHTAITQIVPKRFTSNVSTPS